MNYFGIPRKYKDRRSTRMSLIGVGLVLVLVSICVLGSGAFMDAATQAPTISETTETTSETLPALIPDEKVEPLSRSLPLDLQNEDPDEDIVELEPEDAIYFATGEVNLRAGPGTDFEVLGTLDFGDEIRVIGTTLDGWKKLDDGSFAIADFVSQTPPEKPASGTYYTIGKVNIRSGPSTEYDITRELAKNSPVEVVAITSTGWYRTAVGTYVLASLVVKEAPPTPSPTPRPTPTPTPYPDDVVRMAAQVNLSPKDFEFMAATVVAENHDGFGYEGQVWVAQVIWNRVNSSAWPNSVYGVLYQRNQFSVVRAPYVVRDAQGRTITSSTSSRQAVVQAYQNPPIPNNIIYFCANWRKPDFDLIWEYYGRPGDRANHFYYNVRVQS